MFNAMPDNWVARNGGSFGLLTWQAREALLGTGEVRVFSQQGTENGDFNLIFSQLTSLMYVPYPCAVFSATHERSASPTVNTSCRTIQ